MPTIFSAQFVKRLSKDNLVFDAVAELKKHAWHPQMTIIEAEMALSGKMPYTYITRPREGERGFAISFVNLKGDIEHHPFTLINPKTGMWRNSQPSHIGSLSKVVCDMMECGLVDCRPL